MAGETIVQRPPRASITDLETGDACEFQFNPEEVNEKLTANFAELDVLGLSHKPLQYSNTSNLELDLDLIFSAISTSTSYAVGSPDGSEVTGSGVEVLLRARAFLHSLVLPVRGETNNVVGSGPPKVLFSWPNLYSLVCRVKSVDVKFTRFNLALQPIVAEVKLVLAESRIARLLSEDVRRYGTIRSDGGS